MFTLKTDLIKIPRNLINKTFLNQAGLPRKQRVLRQTNKIADIISQEDKYNFVNDLSVLETIHLLCIGLTSHNLKLLEAVGLPTDRQIIDNLITQLYLDSISA